VTSGGDPSKIGRNRDEEWTRIFHNLIKNYTALSSIINSVEIFDV
jgi:hypothetical protein